MEFIRTRAAVLAALATIGIVAAAASAPASAAPTRPLTYVALGDSYTTGQGADGTQGTPPCYRNPDHSYAGKVAGVLGARLTLVGCSGATTESIIATQLDALSRNDDLVTVSGGGNDLGLFTQFIPQCIQADCSEAPTRAVLRAIANQLPAKQLALYHAIGARIGPHTRVEVMGYPLPMTVLPTGGTDPVCPAFSPGERLSGALIAAALDLETRRAVSKLGDLRFRYVSALRPPFTGHELCGQQPVHFQGITAPHPIHPNDTGTDDYAGILLDALH